MGIWEFPGEPDGICFMAWGERMAAKCQKLFQFIPNKTTRKVKKFLNYLTLFKSSYYITELPTFPGVSSKRFYWT